MLLKGVYSDGDPPLPIPNREVKPVSADGTAEWWESRSMPNLEERASQRDSPFFILSRFSILHFQFSIVLPSKEHKKTGQAQ